MNSAVTQSVQILGSIVDHGGTLTVTAPYIQIGQPNALQSQSIIDLSGIFIANSSFGLSGGASQSGTLDPGGSASFDSSATAGGYVVVGSDASINISGASADIIGRVAPKNAPASRLAANDVVVPSWSDAGTLSFNTTNFLWEGRINAEAGADQGNGGTLSLSGGNVTLQQSAATDVKGVAQASIIAGAAKPAWSRRRICCSSSILVNLGASTLLFNSAVNLAIRDRLSISTASFVDSSATGATVTLKANYVQLSAELKHSRGISATSTPDGNAGRFQHQHPQAAGLTIDAATIDVAFASFSDFANVTLNSTGDIRLTTTSVVDPNVNGGSTNPTSFPGWLMVGGNLTMSAQRIYPVSAVSFEILTVNPTGTVEFDKPAGADTTVPLSAGASLMVSAPTIVQNGNLFVPLGTLQLGAQTTADLPANDTRTVASGTFIPTTSVTLKPGSLTSVSLGNQIVPYGETADGVNWYYNNSLDPLTAAPAKSIVLLGNAVSTNGTMDLSGGGDLLAYEFVQGAGGSRDVLSEPGVYAIFPNNSAAVAASDIHFTSYLGDKQPLAGQQVYLNGASGVAAGWYTRYPAHYATLPGALRIVDDGSALAQPNAAGTTLTDGTEIIGGYFGQSALGLRSSGTELFSVQSSSVWQQYSQMAPSSANAYFSAAAATATARPALPADGGQLAVGATTSLNLSGTFNAQPAAGGLGAELDIFAADIDVIEHGAGTFSTAYLPVYAAQIDAAGFESILIGGRRSFQAATATQAAATLITPTAQNVRVDLGSTALTAPEIILVAKPSTTTVTFTNPNSTSVPKITGLAEVNNDSSGTVTIASGSVVTASGTTGADTGRNYVLGQSLANFLGGTLDTTDSTATNTIITGVATTAASQAIIANYASASGAGAMLLVSNAPNVSVTRINGLPLGTITVDFTNNNPGVTNSFIILPDLVTANPGVVTIAAGAQVGSQSQSVIISATAQSNAIKIADGAGIGGKSVTLSVRSMAVGDNTGATDSLVISHRVLAQLSAVSALTLQTTSGGISFYSFSGLSNCASNCAINFNDGTPSSSLTFDTASLVSKLADVTITAPTVTLLNSGLGAASTSVKEEGQLTINAGEIDLAGGASSIAGFNQVNLNATRRVFVKGAGSLLVGAVVDPTVTTPVPLAINVDITTPNLLVGAGSSGGNGTGSQFALTTLGNLKLTGTGSAPLPSTEIGGNIQINAGTIMLSEATIQAVAGTVGLDATAGNLTIGDGSLISAPGYAQVMIDEVRYTPGGKVVLTSDNGNVATSASSTIDLSQPAGGLAAGGELDISAVKGDIVGATSGAGNIDATILATGQGAGGIFKLDINGTATGNPLGNLAAKLSSAGFSNEVDIHTRAGGLTLLGATQTLPAQTLTAQTIVLTADDPTLGLITIANGAVLDASGVSAGSIALYARSVDLEGTLRARASVRCRPGDR